MATLRSMEHYCTWTPKFHQWLHLSRTHEPNGERLQTTDCHSCKYGGRNQFNFTNGPFLHTPRSGENPSYHSCWLDESDNKRIMRIASSCHRRVFETRVLSSWALVQQGGWYKRF